MYTWWKIYAAIPILCIVFLLISSDVIEESSQFREDQYYFIGFLAYASFLVHGSSIFPLLAIAILASTNIIKNSENTLFIKFRKLIIGFCCLAIPEFIVNKVVPPSGQLIRWHIFGQEFTNKGSSPDSSSLVELFFIQFSDISRVLLNKLTNLLITFVPHYSRSPIGKTYWQPDLNWLEKIRWESQYSPLLGVYTLLVIILLVFLASKVFFNSQLLRNSPGKKMCIVRNKLINIAFATMLITIILEYGGPQSEAILHHRSMAEIVIYFILVVSYIPTFKTFSNRLVSFVMITSMLINLFIWYPYTRLIHRFQLFTPSEGYLSESMVMLLFLISCAFLIYYFGNHSRTLKRVKSSI